MGMERVLEEVLLATKVCVMEPPASVMPPATARGGALRPPAPLVLSISQEALELSLQRYLCSSRQVVAVILTAFVNLGILSRSS